MKKKRVNSFRTLAGITLLEILLALTFTALLAGAISFTIGTVGKTIPRLAAKQTEFESRYVIQDRLTRLIRHAYIRPVTPAAAGAPTTVAASTSTTAASGTYFTSNPTAPSGAGTTTSVSQTGSGTGGSSGGSSVGNGANQLSFTSLGLKVPAYKLFSTDDFETSNQNAGPAAGMTEVGLSTTPVGNAGGKQGLFIRIQRPSDDDPTQGGIESLLIPDAQNVSFEFFDGTTWQPSWNTQTQAAKRLPAAVRVSYQLGDNQQVVFVVPIMDSDVTPANPVASGANQ